MTKAELKQYRSVCAEIQEINIKLKDNTVFGTVRGSDSEFPYTQHTMSVQGITSTKDNIRLLSRLDRLTKQKENVEDFIDSIEDSLIRRIFRVKYIEGSVKRKWIQVAMIIGGNNTADGIRKIHDRYFKKL